MSLLAELKRRKVFKVGGAYIVIAWLAIQVASIAFPAFEAPAWVLRVFILVLMLGFPLALVMAWLLDISSEGLRLEAAPLGNKRMASIAAGLVGLALAWYFIGQPAVRQAVEPMPVVAPVLSAVPAPSAPSPLAAPHKSIAVLAFTDLSPGRDQDYFSDGVSEEILNALVKIKDLRVAGRTSSFYYKGRNEDLRTIGKALGVAHILEGSVRTQGNQVRITAQLIRSEDGFHLWSETFPGDLDDVFQLQDRIARAIAGKLQVVLEGEQKNRLVPVATANAEAYALYLRATEVMHQRDYARMPEAIDWLERAIAFDPQFARAEARLALVHNLLPVHRGGTPDAAQHHALRAIALDPTLAEPHYVLGNHVRNMRRFAEARPHLERALALEAGDASANLYFAQWLIMVGYTREGIQRLERTLAIDPLLPNALNWRGYQYVFAGDLDAGQRMFERARDLGLASLAPSGLSLVARLRGDLETAISLGAPLYQSSMACLQDPATGPRRLMRGAFGNASGERADALAVVDECIAARPQPIPAWVALFLLELGEPTRALASASSGPTTDDSGFMFRLWSPLGAAARKRPEFAEFARRMALVEVWDKYGPPDDCRKADDGDYVCT